MFWADQIAENLKDREDPLWVDDMFTPSGKAHVGSLRGAILHDVIFKSLKDAKKKVKFTYFYNDFDPMDGLPVYLDAKVYEKYMGMPMFAIPAPKGNKNFGDYYGDEFIEILRGCGCEFEVMKDSTEYRKGSFDKVIKTALNNAEKIREIYKNVSGSEKPKDWYPFQPICEKCGKIGTTRVYDWDGKEVSYICDENMVDWAKGCGYKGRMSPFGGTGKMPWKVEWPAKWAALGINVEGEGKDHASKGGSRDLANHLCRDVFNIKPPYDLPYEHIIFAGRKMSKSKGIGISAEDVYASLAPEIIRFIMIRNPNRVIDLNLDSMVIPSLFDEYDRAAKAYSGEIEFPDLARTFKYSQVKRDFEAGHRIKFSKIAYAIQMPNIDLNAWAEKEKGSKLTDSENEDLTERIKFTKIWLERFAPEEFKFVVQKDLPRVSLTKNQKKFLKRLYEVYTSKKSWQGEELHSEIFNIKEELEIEPKEAFGALYQIFLNKDSGPQAGWLLASIDPKLVLDRLSNID